MKSASTTSGPLAPQRFARSAFKPWWALLLLTACAAPPVQQAMPPMPEIASGSQAKPGWAFTQYAVAAANPLATEAGLTILRAGGSAIDAAVAVQMMLTLVEPQSSGIGGGAFLLHFDGNPGPGGVTDTTAARPRPRKPTSASSCKPTASPCPLPRPWSVAAQ